MSISCGTLTVVCVKAQGIGSESDTTSDNQATKRVEQKTARVACLVAEENSFTLIARTKFRQQYEAMAPVGSDCTCIADAC